MEQTRLNKYLAECGICSRREADRLIEEGAVLVNGKTAGPGIKVGGTDSVSVHGKPVKGKNHKVVLAFYKPSGVTCTEKDRHAECKIMDIVHYPVRVTYAGRLDKESEGLLLLTNDGELIRQMMNASYFHEKEYYVKMQRELTDDFLEKMSQGVYLQELDRTTRKCFVEKMGKYTFRIILTQGMNRQIRRMCRELGQHVQSIKRVRVMNIGLGRLRPGEYREITGQELEELYREAGMAQEGEGTCQDKNP